MKILHLTNKPPWPAKDGGAIAILNMVRGFSSLGHRVTILSMNTRKHHTSREEIPEKVAGLADFYLAEVPAEISIPGALWNLCFSKEPYNAIRFISEEYKSALIRLLKGKSFDIIQLEGLYLCPYIPVIREFSNARVVYRAHNIESEIWSRAAAISSGPRKWYLRNLASRILKFEKSWINHYDLLVPITGRDGQMLNRLGNSKPMHVAPTGFDRSILPRELVGMEYPTLFHIGSLEWAPNQEGLLWFLNYCWGNLLERHPELKFYVAGRNAPRWMIDQLSRPGVVFVGEVEDAFNFMRSKAVMVVPLLSGSGMRIKIMEGMALGKAIVSTTIGAEGLAVQNGENILIADTPECFTEKVESLITHRARLDQLGEKAASFIRENLDNRHIAEKLAAFYQNHLT